MGDAGHQLAQRGKLFGHHQLLLCALQLIQGGFGALLGQRQLLGSGRHQIRQLALLAAQPGGLQADASGNQQAEQQGDQGGEPHCLPIGREDPNSQARGFIGELTDPVAALNLQLIVAWPQIVVAGQPAAGIAVLPVLIKAHQPVAIAVACRRRIIQRGKLHLHAAGAGRQHQTFGVAARFAQSSVHPQFADHDRRLVAPGLIATGVHQHQAVAAAKQQQPRAGRGIGAVPAGAQIGTVGSGQLEALAGARIVDVMVGPDPPLRILEQIGTEGLHRLARLHPQAFHSGTIVVVGEHPQQAVVGVDPQLSAAINQQTHHGSVEQAAITIAGADHLDQGLALGIDGIQPAGGTHPKATIGGLRQRVDIGAVP